MISRLTHPNITRGVILVVLVLLICASTPGVSSSTYLESHQPSLTEWIVPTKASGPLALTLDQSGVCCWFLEYYGNKVAHLDPVSNTFEEWSIPTPQANPYSLAVVSISGTLAIWGTERGSDKIFIFLPQSNLFREYSISQSNTGVLGLGSISIEPPGTDVRVWFTETFSNKNGEIIYQPSTGNATLYEDSFPPAAGGGASSVYATSNVAWFAGFSALIRWDRASQQYSLWSLPVHGSAIGRSIAIDRYGQAWYTQGVTNGSSTDNFVGVLRNNQTLQEWHVSAAGADVRTITLDPTTQQPWIVERSQITGGGAIATLNNVSRGELYPSLPAMGPSAPSVLIVPPKTSEVVGSTDTVSPTSELLSESSRGPFTEYQLGASQPSDSIVDSSGHVWVSEPGKNAIAQLDSTDFALGVSTPYVSSARGAVIPITVTGSSLSGYVGDVNFAASGTPPGVTVSAFDPNPLHIPSGGIASSSLSVNIPLTASPGTYFLEIKGNDGEVSHAVGTLIVITNSTSPSNNMQSEIRCPLGILTYSPALILLSSLVVDVLIGAVYISLPVDSAGRKIRQARGLSRRTWLIVALLLPSSFFVGSVLTLIVC